MDHGEFDALTRQTAGGVSRRESIIALGAAGLMAAFAGPLTADAKKKKKKQAAKRCPAAPDLCAPQVGPCTDFVTTFCGGEPSCLDSLACCAEIGRCDVGGFVFCLARSQSN